MSALFWKNIGIVGIAEFLLRMKGVILMPIMTAHLGPVSYGAWGQVALLVTFAPLLIMMGTDHGVTRYMPGESAEKKGRWFFGWMIFGLSGAAIFTLICFLFKTHVAEFLFGDPIVYASFIPLAGAYVVVNILTSVARRWFRIHHDGLVFSLIAFGQAAANITAVILMQVLEQGIYELLIYSLIGDTLTAIAVYIYMARKYGFYKPDFSIIKPALLFGLPLMPAGIAMWVINLSDRLFITHMMGLESVGIYSVGYNLGLVLSEMILRPIRFMYPAMSSELYNQNKMGEYNKFFNLVAGLSVTIMAPAIVGLAMVGPEMVDLLATESFKEASILIPLIAFGYTLNIMGVYFGRAVELKGHPYISTFTLLLAMIVNLALNFLLIPLIGLLGAVLATVASFAFRFGVNVWLAEFYYKVLAFNWMLLVKVTIASAAMGLALIALSAVIQGWTPLATLFLKIAAGIAVYGAISIMLNIMPKEKIRNLTQVRNLKQLAEILNA